MHLDTKDKKLLYHLDCNARQSYAQLSKKVGLSQESTRYRVERLIKQDIIQNFFTIVNPATLNFVFVKVLLRLHNIDQKKLNTIIAYLKKHDPIVWLVEIDGSYDLGLVIRVFSMFELNTFLDTLYQQFHKHINKHQISTNIHGEYLARVYLTNTKRTLKAGASYSAQLSQVNHDQKDRTILRCLTKNARTPALEVAKRMHISVDTVIQRLRKLEKSNTITGYNLVLNNEAMGQIHYKVLIYLNNFDPKNITHFLTLCKEHQRITYIIKSLGPWNFELDLEVESIQQFREIMMHITKERSHMIKDYDALIIRRIHKYNLYP